MPELDTTSGRLRVGDAERERVADLLAEHHAVGRLTLAELDERLSTTLAARTRDDLVAPLADLPATPRTGPQPEPVERHPPTGSGSVDIGWRAHLSSYVAVILGLWLAWAVTGLGYPWPIWPMLGWGLGLIGHRTQVSLCGHSQVRTSAPG